MNQETSNSANAASLSRRQVHAPKHRPSSLDLYVSVGVALLLGLLVRIPILEPVRFLAGMAVGLVIPGYLVAALIFPSNQRLGGWERAGVVLTLNIAIIIITGLLMALFKIPLTAITMANILALLTVVLASVIFRMRRHRQDTLPMTFTGLRSKVVMAMIAFMIGMSGLVWYVVGTNLHKQYTAFSLTNVHDQFSGYPYTLTPHQKAPMRLNIFNPSSSRQGYIVTERTQNRVISQYTVTVGPGQHWFQVIDLPTVQVGSLVHLHFMLKTPQEKILRQLWITYHVTQQ